MPTFYLDTENRFEYVETPNILLGPPFDNPQPITYLFEQPQIMQLMSIVNSFKTNALAGGSI